MSQPLAKRSATAHRDVRADGLGLQWLARPARWVAVAYAVVFAALTAYRNRAFYHDDAYITLRYVRNLLEGAGPVWNAGEYVQGYTNFLHLVLTAGLGVLGVDLVVASQVIGALSFVGMAAVLGWLVSNVGVPGLRSWWHVPVLLTVGSAPLVVWSLGGLEGPLFSLLAASGAGCAVLYLHRPDDGGGVLAASGALLGLAYLARPDGVVLAAVTFAFLAVRSRAVRPPALFSAGALAVVVPYTAWQVATYGSLVPNTFHAKAGAPLGLKLTNGLAYGLEFALALPHVALLPVATVAWVAWRRRASASIVYVSVLTAAYAAYVVVVGGDHMPAFRLFLPIVPLTALIVGLCLPALFGSRHVAPVTAALAVAVGVQAFQPQLNPIHEDPAAYRGTIVGRYIDAQWSEGSLVALSTAGSTPYYAVGFRFIDMLGLNDPVIGKRDVGDPVLKWQRVPGHLKGDGAYVLSRRPDYVILGPAEGVTTNYPRFLSDLELAEDPQFAARYEPVVIRLGDDGQPVEDGGLEFTYYRRVR